MKTSVNGYNLIMKFEGLRLTAYKPNPIEKFWTIGYGHYGQDVKQNMVITREQAVDYLMTDVKRFENAVNKLNLMLTQNQFDALVSFTYNCGEANLKRLVQNRTLNQIADAMLLYNKGSGTVMKGLVKRRQEERKLFLKGYKEVSPAIDLTEVANEVISGKYGNGADRKRRLTEAGYDYKAVQSVVNQLLANR